MPKEDEEEKRQKEGRLNLNSNISVSLRQIMRSREKGLSEAQMLEAILSKRTYLSDEGEEVALKLRHFFALN